MNKLLHLIKKYHALIHLRYICPSCPLHKQMTRDIKGKGRCYWKHNWKKGKYDETPLWMGWKNFFRLHILRKPIKICIKDKTYEAREV